LILSLLEEVMIRSSRKVPIERPRRDEISLRGLLLFSPHKIPHPNVNEKEKEGSHAGVEIVWVHRET
jgi:hypothetical protein